MLRLVIFEPFMFFFAKKGADSVFDHLAAGKWNPCGQWKQVYGFVLMTTADGLFYFLW